MGILRLQGRAKQAQAQEGFGSIWTWVAMDAQSKLVISYRVGDRSASCANDFVSDVPPGIQGRAQVTSDGYKPYIDAMELAFKGDVDYAMLVKVFGTVGTEEQRRYSPPECKGCKRK